MQINNIALSRLLKLELPQLAKGVLQIVEKHEPEVLLIESALNDFESLKPAIESLIVSYGPHPITEQLEPLRKQRILYATAISFQVRGLVSGYIEGTEDHIVVAKAASNRYLHRLRGNNEEVINERVEQFLKEIELNLELGDAVEALGFMKLIDGLKLAHMNLRRLLASRNASISKRDKGVTPVSSKVIRDGLTLLFMRITAAMHDNRELDYSPLVNELNEKLIRYKGLIKSRETILRKKKSAPSTDDESIESARVMPSMRLASVGGFEYDHQDQKKTVAPSSKHMQLPSTNNNEA